MHSKVTEIIYDIQLQPGEVLSLPKDAKPILGPGHWLVSIKPADTAESQSGFIRNHSAFMSSFAPEDEGLYDDYSAG